MADPNQNHAGIVRRRDAGRGIDQVLPSPSDPVLYEDYIISALDYVHLAERAHGPTPRPAPVDYVWGDLWSILTLTAGCAHHEPGDEHYDEPNAGRQGHQLRMHPANIDCLTAVGVDCCVLANSHVGDWGIPGLVETLEALERAGIRTAALGATTQSHHGQPFSRHGANAASSSIAWVRPPAASRPTGRRAIGGRA